MLIVGTFLSGVTRVRSICEDLAARLASRGWPTITTSTRPGRLGRLTDMLHTVWRRRHDYRVAHVEVYGGPAFIWAEAVCASLRWLGKPFVVALHGGSLPALAARQPARMRRLLHAAQAVTAPSRFLIEELGRCRDDVLLVPNPVDVGAYPFRLRERPRPRLVWLRAFHRTYAPELAPRVVALLAPDAPDVSLVMFGPDKGDGSLRRTRGTAEALGVLDRIRFAGAIPKAEVPAALAGGDVFLNTARVDNTPVSVIEAMASGLCVVSTGIGGTPHLLDHEQDALLVPPDHPPAMARAVRRLLADPALASALSRHGREKAERFDWAGILPRWERLLLEAARSARP